MTRVEIDLDDDSVVALKRWRSIATGGVNDILTQLKAAVTPTPMRTIIVTIELPVDTANWFTASTHHYDPTGHAGVVLNAVTSACKWGQRQ